AVEVLVFDLAQGAAVHGVGVVRGEGGDVEAVRAPADLLVGGEADAHRAVGRAARKQPPCTLQNLCHAGLVVGPQQGGAVGDDQALAHVALQDRVVPGREAQVQSLVQNHVAAVVGRGDPGADACAGGVGGGVH